MHFFQRKKLSAISQNLIRRRHYFSNNDNSFFEGEAIFKIKNSDNLYKFFQTNKKFRKEIKEIKVSFKINLFDNSYSLEKINIDNQSNDQIQNVIKFYNKNNLNIFKRIEIKNLFNEIVSNL